MSCYLTIIPPSKVCPQCKTIVPLRLKVCKSCKHVFRAMKSVMLKMLSNQRLQTKKAMKRRHYCVRSKKPGNNSHMCKLSLHSVNSHIGEFTACSTTQKLTNPTQTAKFILQSGTKMLTLSAYESEALRAITDSQTEVSAQELLYAPPFDCTYNKFNVITEIQCMS